MTLEQTVVLLDALVPDAPGGATVEDGVAHVLLPSHSSDRRARLSTPGDRWFALEVDDGFALDVFGEDYTAEEVREILQGFLMVGRAYLEHGGVIRNPKSFWPALTVEVDGVEYQLHRSLVADIRNAVRRFGRKANARPTRGTR